MHDIEIFCFLASTGTSARGGLAQHNYEPYECICEHLTHSGLRSMPVARLVTLEHVLYRWMLSTQHGIFKDPREQESASKKTFLYAESWFGEKKFRHFIYVRKILLANIPTLNLRSKIWLVSRVIQKNISTKVGGFRNSNASIG